MNIFKIFRFFEWKDTHLSIIITGFIIWSYYYQIDVTVFSSKLFYLFLTALLVGSFGYYINDCFDIEKDALADKTNNASKHSLIKRLFILFGLFVAVLGLWKVLNESHLILYLICVELLLLTLYPIKYIRLKERPFIAILIDSLYAFVIWGMINVYLILPNNESLQSIHYIYFIWLFIIGLRGIISHHIKDYQNDIRSNTRTTATKYGVEKMLLIQKIILPPIEFVLFGVFLYLINQSFLLIYIGFLLLTVFHRNNYSRIFNTYFIKTKVGIVNLLLTDFYLLYLPIIMLIGLCFRNVEFIWIVLVYFVIFFNKVKQFYLNINTILLNPLYWKIYPTISLIVNYSLYYSFLLIGINLKKRAAEKAKDNSIILPNQEGSNTDTNPINSMNNNQVLSKVIEPNVHGLWIGEKLSNMELLTIHSFLKNGYVFHLWTYNPLENQLPEGVILCDANEIISEDKIFTYKNASQFGNGLGSVAGFSDIFRYKLLYEKGGWWVDMDITCLEPFDVTGDYFFRAHNSLDVVGNVIKAPAKSELMRICYEQAIASVDENNTDWHKPIQILCDAIHQLNLKEHIYADLCNTDEFQKFEMYYFSDVPIPKEWKFIHWNNEILRTYGLHKDHSFYNSVYSQLLRKYNLMEEAAVHSLINKKFKRQLLIANLKKIL